MRRLLPFMALASFLGVGPPSCGRSNPDYCAPDTPCPADKRCVPSPNLNTGEGTCVAPADLGGAVCSESLTCGADQPLCDPRVGVCRACRAGEDDLCSGRSSGDTPRCAQGRCVQCALPTGVTKAHQVAECTARGAPKPGQAPICDKNVCRGCERHDECDSGVCVKDTSGELYKLSQGTCVPVEQVLAVSSVTCSPTGPVYCRPQDAIKRLGQQVDAGSRYRYVVFQSGGLESDFSEILIGTESAHRGLDLHLIAAPNADDPVTQMKPGQTVSIGASKRRGFVVSGDVRVTLEGFHVHNASIGVDCSGAGAVETQVRVQRSWLTENSTALQGLSGCVMIVEDSAVGGRTSKEGGNLGAVATINRSDFQFINTIAANNGDPSQMPLNGFGGIKIYGSLGGRKTSRIVNSVFFQNSVALQGKVAMGQRAGAVWCDQKLDKPLVLLNSLFMQGSFAAGTTSAFIPADCGDQVLVSSVLADDENTAKPKVTMEELGSWGAGFVPPTTAQNDAQRRLLQGGVKELAIITDTVVAPTRDLSGAARPSGQNIAIGPYEPQP